MASGLNPKMQALMQAQLDKYMTDKYIMSKLYTKGDEDVSVGQVPMIVFAGSYEEATGFILTHNYDGPWRHVTKPQELFGLNGKKKVNAWVTGTFLKNKDYGLELLYYAVNVRGFVFQTTDQHIRHVWNAWLYAKEQNTPYNAGGLVPPIPAQPKVLDAGLHTLKVNWPANMEKMEIDSVSIENDGKYEVVGHMLNPLDIKFDADTTKYQETMKQLSSQLNQMSPYLNDLSASMSQWADAMSPQIPVGMIVAIDPNFNKTSFRVKNNSEFPIWYKINSGAKMGNKLSKGASVVITKSKYDSVRVSKDRKQWYSLLQMGAPEVSIGNKIHEETEKFVGKLKTGTLGAEIKFTASDEMIKYTEKKSIPGLELIATTNEWVGTVDIANASPFPVWIKTAGTGAHLLGQGDKWVVAQPEIKDIKVSVDGIHFYFPKNIDATSKPQPKSHAKIETDGTIKFYPYTDHPPVTKLADDLGLKPHIEGIDLQVFFDYNAMYLEVKNLGKNDVYTKMTGSHMNIVTMHPGDVYKVAQEHADRVIVSANNMDWYKLNAIQTLGAWESSKKEPVQFVDPPVIHGPFAGYIAPLDIHKITYYEDKKLVEVFVADDQPIEGLEEIYKQLSEGQSLINLKYAVVKAQQNFKATPGQLRGGAWDMIHTKKVNHPVSPERIDSLQNIIISLNDTYNWTRESIADWLDTLDEQPIFYPQDPKSTKSTAKLVTLK